MVAATSDIVLHNTSNAFYQSACSLRVCVLMAPASDVPNMDIGEALNDGAFAGVIPKNLWSSVVISCCSVLRTVHAHPKHYLEVPSSLVC